MSSEFQSHKIAEFIKEGNYDLAIKHLKRQNHPIVKYYLSRIYELTGRFHLALQTVSEPVDITLDPNNSEQDRFSIQLRYDIAKSYALWRLMELETGKSILEEYILRYSQLQEKVPLIIGDFYNILGLIYWKNDELSFAETYFRLGLEYRVQVDDEYGVSYSLNNLGNTFLLQDELKLAEDYYNQAFDIRNKLGYLPAIAASYNSFGRLEDRKNNHLRARDFHLQSFGIWKDLGNTQFIAKSYRFLGINAYYLDDPVLMKEYFEKSDNLFELLGNEVDLFTNEKIRSKLKEEE